MQVISIDKATELKGILSQEDLAFYIVLSTLATLSRAELKESVIKNSSILALLETVPDTNDILDNFMMGRYEQFQRQLNTI